MEKTQVIKWNDEAIENAIKEVVKIAKINSMPTHSLMKKITGNEALSNAVSKHGGSKYWADKLGLEAFKKDHNTEHLVDAANYLMFRYMYPMPNEHFMATDSDGSVGTVGTPINMEHGV